MFVSKRSPHLRQSVYSIGITFLTFLLVLTSFSTKTQIEQIQDRGVLHVATLTSPLTYYLNGSDPEGLEYHLAKHFADYLGVSLRIRVYPDIPHLLRAVDDRSTQILAAGLSRTEPWENKYVFSKAYDADRPVIIYRETQGFTPANNIKELIGAKIELVSGSASEILMKGYQKTLPKLRWRSINSSNDLDLLTRLQNRKIDYVIVSERLWKKYASYHPELKASIKLGDRTPISWLTRKHIDTSLEDSLELFFQLESSQKLIADLRQTARPPENPLNYVETVAFRNAVETRYQKLKPYFAQAAEQSGFDALLLSAIAYQESHWKADAVSATGVRGIMMLTERAASEVDVTDRTDPRQSIIGGAKYLQLVMDKIPDRITQPDRLWFALAGYNVGYGHLEDARILTQKAGKDPDNWMDVREFLPLLADETVYPETRYGFARGEEPVTYVRNVRAYQKILQTEERLNQIRSVKIDPIN